MQAIIDRIEGNIAVLEVDGTRFMDVPLAETGGLRQGRRAARHARRLGQDHA